MKDSELDQVLSTATRRPIEVSPRVLDEIAHSIGASMQPVRPLPPVGVLMSWLLALIVSVVVAGAALSGFGGIEALSAKGRIAIFVTLAILGCVTARELVSQFIPGSRHIVSPRVLPTAVVAGLLAVFVFLFHDYGTDHFVTAGVTCLTTGLIYAAPAGLISAWVLRRGFAVSPDSAGLLLGTLSGIAGVAMLELHCTNFQAPHLLWHLLVVPLAGIAGTLVGKRFAGRA